MPIPAAPPGSLPVSTGVDVHERDDGGVVFVWGMAAWCWQSGDVVGRRLAAVQIVETGAGRAGEVAVALGVDDVTLWRWRRDYREGGVVALAPERRGPRGPSKLTEEKIAEISRLRAEGLSQAEIAVRVGVGTGSVSRALAVEAAPVVPAPSVPEMSGLVPLARPEPRHGERQAARRGELAEAEPRVCEGASLPLAGVLVILPALAITGLLECVEAVYGRTKAAFYGLRSLVLTVVFAALVGEPRAEGLTRLDPVDVGRLLGLDRAPEPKTLRRRFAALAEQQVADRLLAALACRHIEAHPDTIGLLYVDGHVRAYHGQAKIPKAHVARIRLSMPAEIDTWVADARGDALVVFNSPPGVSLVGELRRVAAWARGIVGPDRRVTICFDRGGWSPRLFAELYTTGFDILTYRKGVKPVEPRSRFVEHVYIDDAGRAHTRWLADRRVRISYKDNSRNRYFACRQITRLDPDSGHQTQILTTLTDPDPAPIAHAMFSRWRQENFFRYQRAHYALDALDSYETTDDDPHRLVPNPARRAANRQVRDTRNQIIAAQAEEGRAAIDGRRAKTSTVDIDQAFTNAHNQLAELETAARTIPTKIPLAERDPDAARLHPERKRIHDAIRLATYNAESALARLLAPHYARADDEARSLLHEIFHAPADLEIIGNELHVRIHHLSNPRRTRALTGLCADLTATQTTYPGTNLTLTYTVEHT